MLKLLGDGLAQIPPQVGKEPDLPHAARRVEPRGAAPGAREGRRGEGGARASCPLAMFSTHCRNLGMIASPYFSVNDRP